MKLLLGIPLVVVPALLLTTTLFAADPEGFAIWKADELKTRTNASKLDAHKAGLDRPGSWGNHSLLLVRREGDGEAEVHETQVDVITVVSGEGTLVVGGTVVGGHSTAPGEIRGSDLTGGTKYKMSPGDVIHVPAKVPHRMLVPKYLSIQVVKVETK